MLDTIFALSSGNPPAAIGIIRISGPAARAIHSRFVDSTDASTKLYPRRARLVTLQDPVSGAALDQVVALFFPGPGSATGEDIVEWHCHGGRAVVRAISAALEADAGARPAEAGEFTRRAFANGRIDLNEAEGLADLLSAQTEGQRRAALRMADGHFSKRIEQWRGTLLDLAAQAEARLDFSDEGDVPDADDGPGMSAAIEALAGEIRAELRHPSAERLHGGIHLVIAGPPNSGKSTLLNALAGREVAIVSDIAGTTRDRIEAPVVIEGIAFILTDTAGLRAPGEDVIEALGMARAQAAVAAADLVLWLGQPAETPRPDAIRLGARCDAADFSPHPGHDLRLSVKTGEGMADLVALLAKRAAALLPADDEYVLHARQREAIGVMAASLDRAREAGDMLIIAEELRQTRLALDRLTGRAGVEDMLGALFGRFCIGK